VEEGLADTLVPMAPVLACFTVSADVLPPGLDELLLLLLPPLSPLSRPSLDRDGCALFLDDDDDVDETLEEWEECEEESLLEVEGESLLLMTMVASGSKGMGLSSTGV